MNINHHKPAVSSYGKLQFRLKSNARTWLVTGVAGFIGSNLLETLLKLEQRGLWGWPRIAQKGRAGQMPAWLRTCL